MSAVVIPFRRPAPKLDYSPNDWLLFRTHVRDVELFHPELAFRGDWIACLKEFWELAIRHHVTGTLYRIMKAREVRQQ